MPNPITVAIITIEILVSQEAAEQALTNKDKGRALRRWIKQLSATLDGCIEEFRDEEFMIRLVPEFKVRDD